jgi:hypothetical protein
MGYVAGIFAELLDASVSRQDIYGPVLASMSRPSIYGLEYGFERAD